MEYSISIFDKLAGELDSDERRELLKKIKIKLQISSEPIKIDNEIHKEFDLEAEYLNLGFWKRLILMIKSILKDKDKLSILQDDLLNKLKRQVERQYPGMADMANSMFRSPMKHELEELYRGSVFFREPLTEVIVKKKEDFVAFLTGMIIPEIQTSIKQGLNPHIIEAELPEEENSGIKQEINKRFDQILSSITPSDREQIYQDAQTLHFLHSLSQFRLDEMIAHFEPSLTEKGESCPFRELENYFIPLANILASFQMPPSSEAAEAIHLFLFQERLNADGFDLESNLISN